MDEKTLKKGERYYRTGKVLWVVKSGDRLYGKVLGGYPYYVEIDIPTGENKCTCPLGGDCKHVAAVLRAYEAGACFEDIGGRARVFPEVVAMEHLEEVPDLALDVTLKELMFALGSDESGSEVARLFRRAMLLVKKTGRAEVLHILRDVLDEYSHVFADYRLAFRLEEELRELERAV